MAITFSTRTIAVQFVRDGKPVGDIVTRPLRVIGDGAFGVVRRGAVYPVTPITPSSGRCDIGAKAIDPANTRVARAADMRAAPAKSAEPEPAAKVAMAKAPKAKAAKGSRKATAAPKGGMSTADRIIAALASASDKDLSAILAALAKA